MKNTFEHFYNVNVTEMMEAERELSHALSWFEQPPIKIKIHPLSQTVSRCSFATETMIPREKNNLKKGRFQP